MANAKSVLESIKLKQLQDQARIGLGALAKADKLRRQAEALKRA